MGESSEEPAMSPEDVVVVETVKARHAELLERISKLVKDPRTPKSFKENVKKNDGVADD